ncbi:MAG TPA: beta-galactosidase [bacterium]|nr:beta-galactosidase [bacterium]
MRKLLTFYLLLGCLFIPDPVPAASFFTVNWEKGKAWFVTPSGKPFLSMGVNAIGDQSYRAPNDDYYNPVPNQYHGDKKAWVRSVFTRLKEWGFNSVGCWSDEAVLKQKFPYTFMLYIGRGKIWDDVLLSVFTPDFERTARANAQKALPYKEDPYLIGYFLDNEMPWWGDFGWKAEGQRSLLEKYALSGIDNENKQALKKFFEDRYHQNIDAFDDAWGLKLKSFDGLEGPVTLSVRTRAQKTEADAWAGVVADRYFAVTTQALREVDPHHLVLGVRFAGENPWEVVEACGRYCDVVSVNVYSKSGDVPQQLLDNFHAMTKKPLLLTEYSYSAMENQSGDPNTHGADVSVPTQKDRVEHLERFAKGVLELPYMVGMHWFEWSDESPQGRFDGEDQDYGLVDIHDKPYDLLTRAHAKLNQRATAIHKGSKVPLPTAFVEPKGPEYRKADPNAKVPDVRDYLRIDTTAHVDTWGDNATGGKAVANTTSGTIELEYSTGTGWGCGASIPSNIEPLVAWGTVDLRGYHHFTFQAFVPKDVHFSVFMSESGCAAPGQAQYDGKSGADGESYSFPAFTGTGKWADYGVDLSELELRNSWGNQKGNQVLDLQALSDVQFYLPGNQGTGKMLIKDLKFRVK